MKRWGILGALLLALFISAPADASRMWAFTCLTGGTEGCLDKWRLYTLASNQTAFVADGDQAIGIVAGAFRAYYFDGDATDAEDGDLYIRPDDYATSGVWRLAGFGITGAVATDTIWDANGDTVYGTGSDTANRLAIGTAGQIYKVNALATAPEWSSSLAIVSISSGVYWTDGATGGAYIQLREDTDNGTDSSNIKGANDAGANPAFTFYGSAASSEDLVLTASANTWTLSSSTGVTEINASAINLVTTGTIDGAIPVIESSSSPVTAAGSSRFYTNNQDAVITYNLPAVPTGKAYCFANTLYARAITVNPDDADYILMAGTAGAAGEAIVSTGAATDMVCIVGINASYWRVTAKEGTWAQETP